MDLGLGPDFWTLLPAFVVVTLVGGIKNMGDSVAVQQASWHQSRVPDFRLVQGSLNTNGLGILFSGLAGTPPTTVHSARSVTLVTMTSVAARRVGYLIGAAHRGGRRVTEDSRCAGFDSQPGHGGLHPHRDRNARRQRHPHSC